MRSRVEQLARAATLAATLSLLVCAAAIAASVPLVGHGRGDQGRVSAEPEGSIHATTTMEIAHAQLHNGGFEKLDKMTDTVAIWPLPSRPAAGEGPKYDDFLHEQVCGSALVVQGEVIASHSMLNQMETFLFTDYLVKIEIPIRNTRQQLDNTPVVVTSPGGQITLNGKKVSAFISSSPSISNGRRYIFLLDSLSEDKDYRPRPKIGVIEDQGRRIAVSPRGKWSPEIFFTDRLTFADIQRDVRDAAAHCK
jgi:hypothetical protein